jgi:hypothetical protein
VGKRAGADPEHHSEQDPIVELQGARKA